MIRLRKRLTRPVKFGLGMFGALLAMVAFIMITLPPPVTKAAPNQGSTSNPAVVLANSVVRTTSTTALPTSTSAVPTTVEQTTSTAASTPAPRIIVTVAAATSTTPTIAANTTTTSTVADTTTTEPPTSSSTSSSSTSTTSTTTVVPSRQIDLGVRGTFIGPLVANRLAFVSVTVTNAGPDPATSPRVTATVPAELSEVVSLDAAWACTHVGRLVACDGPPLGVAASATFALRGRLSEDIVLKSAGLRPGRRPTLVAPQPISFRIEDRAVGNIDRNPASDVSELPFPTVADRGIATLTTRSLHGGVAMTGNSLLTCDATAASCAAAMASGDNETAIMRPTNQLAATMTGTTASSSAALSLPAGSTVAEAWLVWGAVSMDGTPLPITNIATGWLATKAGATVVHPSLQMIGTTDAYVRADVTDLVKQTGTGVYGMGLQGGLASVNGPNQSAGWALIVVYENPAEPLRSVTVLDGLSTFGGGPAVALDLGSLAPVSTASTTSVGLVAFDGDRGRGDGVCLNGVRLTDALHPAATSSCSEVFPSDDVFASRISFHGVGAPTGTDTLGFDLAILDVKVPVLLNNQLVINATADLVRLSVITISIDR